jgi:hypothetical protein
MSFLVFQAALVFLERPASSNWRRLRAIRLVNGSDLASSPVQHQCAR